MKTRWLVAVGACLALALLTLPFISHDAPAVGVEARAAATPSAEAAEAAEAADLDTSVCDAEQEPAKLDFKIKDMNGESVNLSAYKGKVIVLDFWATWCGPCKIEIPGFVELQDKYRDDGLVVLGLSVDDPIEKLKPFADEFEMNYPVLVGLGRNDVQDAFGPIWGIPTTVMIGRDGNICKKHVGMGSKEDFETVIKALL